LTDPVQWIDIHSSVWRTGAICAAFAVLVVMTMLYQAPSDGGRAIQALYASTPSKVVLTAVWSIALFGGIVQLVQAILKRPRYRARFDEIRILQLSGYKTVVRGRWWLADVTTPGAVISIHSDAGGTCVLNWVLVPGGKASLRTQLQRAMAHQEAA
jgi:hypothetical protein